MTLTVLPDAFTVCKLHSLGDAAPVQTNGGIFFLSQTENEISLVCSTAHAPKNTLARKDGWRAFHIAGQLDFSLIGILAEISAILAHEGIGIFVVSTYNTDYVLTKAENLPHALAALQQAGHTIQYP